MTRWWRNLFSVSFAWIFRETLKTMDNKFSRSILLSTIEMTSKCSKLSSELVFDVISIYGWGEYRLWKTDQSETARDWFDWFGEEREFKTLYVVLFPYIFLEIRMFSVLDHALQVVNLLDRLIKKENQTATVPLVSDIPPYVDNCQVVICNERGGRSIQSFGNPACASGRYENLTSLFS